MLHFATKITACLARWCSNITIRVETHLLCPAGEKNSLPPQHGTFEPHTNERHIFTHLINADSDNPHIVHTQNNFPCVFGPWIIAAESCSYAFLEERKGDDDDESSPRNE